MARVNPPSEPASLPREDEPATLRPMPVETPDFGDAPDLAAWLSEQHLQGRPRHDREAGVEGWTHEDLARACDVSVSAARSWLRGTHMPDYRQLWRLRVVFGDLPPEWCK